MNGDDGERGSALSVSCNLSLQVASWHLLLLLLLPVFLVFSGSLFSKPPPAPAASPPPYHCVPHLKATYVKPSVLLKIIV